MLQMRRAQLVGLLGRMEGIAEADEPGDALLARKLVGDEARHPPAHRFAADESGAPAGTAATAARYSSIRRSARGGGFLEPPSRRAAM